MALRLHAITLADAPHNAVTAPATDGTGSHSETMIVPFRDLSAVVTEQRVFALDDAGDAEVERHRAIVDAAFHRSAVLPAPVGAVFRSADVLKRWMELHYVSLNDALQFVEDREVARVHVVRADGKGGELEAGSDLAAAAAESFRALRRRAVAAVPLRLEEVTGLVLSAAFLVERDLWKDFGKAVEEQQDAHHLLHFDVTGPWAPYDFVRMQFGG
ncbi:MAG TPA: GvpL/GvpF family gas vesicle protein [Gemmatimonadaceae bacterium]|nr:GvpL/GvpF family gas vesicle protein [Gemmatimonadaceae bacterium]